MRQPGRTGGTKRGRVRVHPPAPAQALASRIERGGLARGRIERILHARVPILKFREASSGGCGNSFFLVFFTFFSLFSSPPHLQSVSPHDTCNTDPSLQPLEPLRPLHSGSGSRSALSCALECPLLSARTPYSPPCQDAVCFHLMQSRHPFFAHAFHIGRSHYQAHAMMP